MHLVLLYYYLVFSKNKLYEYLSNQTMTHLQAALEKKKGVFNLSGQIA